MGSPFNFSSLFKILRLVNSSRSTISFILFSIFLRSLPVKASSKSTFWYKPQSFKDLGVEPPDTWDEFGILGVLFLLSSTSLFITLGFLYAKWNKDNDQLKKIGVLSFTLLFDVLMAYEIVEKIHLLKYNMGMEMKEWVPTMVFTNINFWIIICAGFAAYIIWGFVFEFLILIMILLQY